MLLQKCLIFYFIHTLDNSVLHTWIFECVKDFFFTLVQLICLRKFRQPKFKIYYSKYEFSFSLIRLNSFHQWSRFFTCPPANSRSLQVTYHASFTVCGNTETILSVYQPKQTANSNTAMSVPVQNTNSYLIQYIPVQTTNSYLYQANWLFSWAKRKTKKHTNMTNRFLSMLPLWQGHCVVTSF